jgi:hypothetical protein
MASSFGRSRGGLDARCCPPHLLESCPLALVAVHESAVALPRTFDQAPVSGLRHEVMFYYIITMEPDTREVAAFFALHGSGGDGGRA